MSTHGLLAFVVGSEPPAMSISWEPPLAPHDSGFIVFMADLFPGDPGFEDLPHRALCLHCLLENADEQIGEGLDIARRSGRADWDDEAA